MRQSHPTNRFFHSPLRTWVAITIALVLPTTLGAQLLTSPGLEGELVLRQQTNGHALTWPDGRQQTLPLPTGAKVHGLVAKGENWYATAIDQGEIILLQGTPLDIKKLAVPATDGDEVFSPIPLADQNGLQGLIWLSGRDHRSLAVRAALRDQGAWKPTRIISPPGPGSQLALVVTALPHPGHWLATWAAFDGEDDEIVWSSFNGESWTAPAPVVTAGNSTPDITPQLRATSTGALLAWSRLENGRYHVATAVYDGKTWSDPKLIGAPGTLYPTFSSQPGSPLITVRQVVPSGWQVLETDENGNLLNRTTLPTTDRRRPRVVVRNNAGLRLQWMREDSTMIEVFQNWQPSSN